MSIESRSQELADILVTRNFEPDYFKAGRSVTTAQDADMFSFDYVGASGRNYGTVVIMFQEDDTFLLLASNNMARGMEDADADAWFGFLNQLKQWAVSPGTGFRNFSIENIAKLRHHQAGMAAIREGLFEGYYGTRHISYVGEATQARLMIRHKRPLGEGDARHRQIDSLFLETADGERYRLPFRQLAGGRAMLEHVRAGGRPWDVRGVHITEMVSELAVLSRFRRASAGRVLEGISQQVVESAAHYYDALRESIRRLGSSRGYADYFESWTPADIGSHEELVEDIRQLFVEQTLDARIESALPLLARIQQKENSMKEIAVFEAWTDRVMEGTWELPETPEQKNQLRQLLSQPLTVGVDAMDATEQLGGLVGDDELFDRLTDLADRDPNANAWDDSAVMDRMWELADASPELADALTQIGTPTGPEDDQPGVAEEVDTGEYDARRSTHKGETTPEQEKKFRDKVRQYGDELEQRQKEKEQGVAEDSLNELSTDLLQRSAQVAKDKSKQAMDPKIHDALGGGYKNPLARHYDSLSQKFDRGAEKAKQRDTAKTIASIASPAVMRKIGIAEQDIAEGYQLDEGAVETITALVKKIPGIGKYYQLAQQYKPQLIQILKTSKSGKEVKQKMEQLVAQQPAPVAESGLLKQLGGLAVGGGSILSTLWMNAMGMIDGVLAHAAAGEIGGAVASGSILGLIPVTLMLFAAMLLFKGAAQSSDEKAQQFQAQRGQQGMSESASFDLELARLRELLGR